MSLGKLAHEITNLYEEAYYGRASYLFAKQWGDWQQQLDGLARAIAEEDRAQYLPAGIAADVAAALKPVLANLDRLRTDATAYAIDGRMRPDGSWHLHLFKRHFQVKVAAGCVAQVKLRCQKKYLGFALDPGLHYEINGKDGDCWMELDGSPDASFQLIQF